MKTEDVTRIIGNY